VGIKNIVKSAARRLPSPVAKSLVSACWLIRSKGYERGWRLLRFACSKVGGRFEEGGPARGVFDFQGLASDQGSAVDFEIHDYKETSAEFHGGRGGVDTFTDNPTIPETIAAGSFCDAIVDGATSAVTDADGKLIAEISPYTRCSNAPDPWDHKIFTKFGVKTRSEYLSGRSMILSSANDAVFFHWLLEVVPKLWVRENSHPDYVPDRFLISRHKPFVDATLTAAGIEDRVHVMEPGVRYLCDEVWGCGEITPQGGIKSYSDWLRELILGKETANADRKGDGEIVYIHRPEKDMRSVANQDKIADGMRDLGANVVDLGALPLAEQAAVFDGARLIVGAHGSALANLVFCRAGTSVVELFSPGYVRLLYPRIGDQLGLDYHCWVGEGEMERPNQPGIYDDIRIDPDSLLKLVAKLANR